MTISDLFNLLGGLGLFLYGMNQMRDSLEKAAEKRMSKILKTITATTMRGFLAGTGITAVLQSSAVVTVLLVGLVDAGVMSLQQTAGVILGANIGTTITCQLTALDVGALAPLMTFGGVFLLLFSQKEWRRNIGGAMAGFGFMFSGLHMMEAAMMPLGESERFRSILIACNHPVTGILAGTIFTALLQSSTASVSVLQTLAKSGMIGMRQGIFIVFGQNIGTCLTALLASAGANIHAKRTAVLHLLINILGTVLFWSLCQMLPVVTLIERLSPLEPARQIANAHTIFNVVTSLVLLPFCGRLVWLVERVTIQSHDSGI